MMRIPEKGIRLPPLLDGFILKENLVGGSRIQRPLAMKMAGQAEAAS